MRPKNPHLTLLWQTEPAKAAAQVLDAVKGTSSLEDAARELGVGRSTLFRWLKRPELVEARAT